MDLLAFTSYPAKGYQTEEKPVRRNRPLWLILLGGVLALSATAVALSVSFYPMVFLGVALLVIYLIYVVSYLTLR